MTEDIVIETLQQKYEQLWEINHYHRQTNHHDPDDMMRYEQMEVLEKAMKVWMKHKARRK